MNPFLEHLPWRIAAVAGLVVGGVSLWAGTGLWVTLMRVGVAFVIFAFAGFGLRFVLQQGAIHGGPKSGSRAGAHVDQTTPPMTVEDVSRPAEGVGRRGDEKE
jgi:hypothetical protein